MRKSTWVVVGLIILASTSGCGGEVVDPAASSTGSATPPAARAPADGTAGGADAGTESLSVFGATNLAVSDELSFDELQERCAPPADAPPPAEAGPSAAEPGAADGEPSLSALAAGDPAYVLVASWTSSNRRTVNLRQGTYNPVNGAGWGYAKITQKHNLNTASVKRTTQYPGPGFPQKDAEPDTWVYSTPVAHVQCSGWWIFRRCKVTQIVDVRVVVNYAVAKGVITAYCSGIAGACPSWVKNAANL